MRFTDIFIKRPVLSLVVSLLILLVGLRAMSVLPIRQYPKLSSTVITITTVYPGATADLMQGFITTPIEQAVASADGIDYMTSSSMQGQSTVTVYVKLNYDPSAAMTDVMAKVQQVKYLLPKESYDPVITKSTGEATDVMYIGFSSKTLDGAAISDYLTRVVQPLIATVDGVASADILGGQTFAMRVWLDPARMAAHGVSADDVAAALQANNVQSAPGQVKGLYTVYNITADTDVSDVGQFRRLVVKANGDSLVRLEDVATLSLGAQSTDSSVMFSGLNAVFIGVQVTPTGNPLQMVQDVRKLLPELQRDMPPAIQMKVAYDSTTFINASIAEVEHTLIEAIGIVIVVIFLFLGSVRSVLIPVITIPLSLIGAFSLMLAAGFSLNLLTLLAMVLAIGLVVDDAIVVVENVYRHLEEGRTPVQAALIGAREIAGPVIAMTITLAAVYAPIGLLGGVTGVLFREFAFTLAGAVIISGIVALTLSPMMASMLLPQGGVHTPFARLIDRVFSRVSAAYHRRLTRALDYRPVIFLFAGVVLAAIPYLYLHGRAELAPEEDQGILFTQFKGPQYANIDYTQFYARQLDEAGKTLPEATDRFFISGTSGTNIGFGGVQFKPWSERARSAKELQPALQRAFGAVPGVNALVFNLPALPGTAGGLPVQMVLSTTHGFKELFETMEKVKADARASGKFMIVDSDLDFDLPVVRVHVNRAMANEMGVTMQSVADTLALLVGGNYVNRFNLQGRSYEVIPQVARTDRLTADTLTRYYVKAANGQQVPLSTLVTLSNDVDPNALTHYNQLNSATFQAVPMPGQTMGDAVTWLEREATSLPLGYSHSYLSQTRQYVEEGNKLAATFAFAIIVIFLVLAAQFESLRDPLVIIVSVPMAICGALVPLFIGFATINIYTQVGLVTLVGLISKHGILMVEFANELQVKEGLDRRGAILAAARVRLRPILMTTAAMVVGLLPLLIASGAGAASRYSIGLVVVVGMSIGTLFTLFVLPAVYTVLAKDHQRAAGSSRLKQIAEIG